MVLDVGPAQELKHEECGIEWLQYLAVKSKAGSTLDEDIVL